MTQNGSIVSTQGKRIRRKNYARTPTVLELPRLTEVQLRSFEWFKIGRVERTLRRDFADFQLQ